MKPSIKIPLYNGSLECEFRKYQMFDGKLKDFRSEGGVVKTDDEKRQMAEKHRFKKEREFKKRLEEQEEKRQTDVRREKYHQAYLQRKASGSQKRYEDKVKAEKKAEMDAKKDAYRAEDIANGVFTPVKDLPRREPKRTEIESPNA